MAQERSMYKLKIKIKKKKVREKKLYLKARFSTEFSLMKAREQIFFFHTQKKSTLQIQKVCRKFYESVFSYITKAMHVAY